MVLNNPNPPSYTTSSTVALKHLQHLKPGDGWSIQQRDDDKTLRLLRRNVPLTDNSFVDLYYDGDDVVGILSTSKSTAQAQILVDSQGQPVRGIKLKTIPWNTSSNTAAATSTSPSGSRSSVGATSTTGSTWTPQQHQQLWQTVGAFVVGSIAIRLVFQTMMILYIVALPLLYLYLVQTCPSESSFEPKKELKRVLRGHHLPENHPDKPKGWLGETLARLNATVATELATGLGYEVTIVPLAGAIRVSCVRVPAAKMDFYWVGALNGWYYVYSNEIPSDKSD